MFATPSSINTFSVSIFFLLSSVESIARAFKSSKHQPSVVALKFSISRIKPVHSVRVENPFHPSRSGNGRQIRDIVVEEGNRWTLATAAIYPTIVKFPVKDSRAINFANRA